MTIDPSRRAEAHAPMPPDASGALCVLASGSRGNCSVLVVSDGGTRRVILIDAGLSPRRTGLLLAGLGIELWEIDAVLLTHLDSDHANLSWARHRHLTVPLYIHASHRGQAERLGMMNDRVRTYHEPFRLFDRVDVSPRLLRHDTLGVVAFRLTIEGPDSDRVSRLGFATDVGTPSDDLVEHLHSCDVLGIESNYCPKMQRESDRPEFLKRRVMGGAGHLSNDECLEVVRRARPRSHVVLLHLSQQCNDPAIVSRLHHGAAYRATLSNQHHPTPWICLPASDRGVPEPVVRKGLPLLSERGP